LIRDIIRYSVIIIISIFASLYCFEFYLGSDFKDHKLNKRIKAYEKKTNKKYDKRNKIVAYKELKKKNSNLANTVTPKTYALYPEKEIMPLSGKSNSKTIVCNENGYYSIFKSDRFGFNNPDQEWNSDEIEYFLTGDSFAMGACVNRPHDFGSVLRNLSGKAALTLGYTSNGPLIEFAVLREYLDSRVKNVLWIYYEGNDLDDLQLTLKNKILNKYLLDKNFKQNLKNKQTEINRINKQRVETAIMYLDERRKKYKILRFIRLDRTKNFIKKITNPPKELIFNEKILMRFKKILKMSRDLAKDNGAKFYFVYLPSYESLKSENQGKDKHQRSKIISIIKELNINLIDIKDIVLKKEINYLNLFPCEVCHYSVEGYKKITNLIYEETLK
jgi:hypothetical protein